MTRRDPTRKIWAAMAVSFFVFALLPDYLHPCTTFCFRSRDAWIFGRNYDFEIEYGLVIVNKRGVVKTALLSAGTEGTQPAKWISRYGSITFNQFGREHPLGGMNEAGLVIELMWLAESQYPDADQRPALGELQWIQYQLDTAETVQDIIASDSAVRIDAKRSSPIHFLLCDHKGGAAVIEFLGGRMRAYSGRDLPIKALTNSTYESSLEYFRRSGSEKIAPSRNKTGDSLERFVCAARGTQAWDAKTSADPVAHAFQVLDYSSLSNSRFRIVYDVGAGIIYFRTRSAPDVRSIEFRQFDFSCGTPVKILNMLADLKGDVTGRFQDYTWEANYDLIKKSFSETSFLKGTSEAAMIRLSKYPESLFCK